jgi:hypothetical protein
VPQQQAVGELLVDDTDVAGDDDGPLRPVLPDPLEAVQHRLHAAADQGEDEEVVGLLAHGAQELDRRDLAERVGGDADLAELTGGGSGAAAQQVSVQADACAVGRVLRVSGGGRRDAVRGERAPFPPGVGIREDRHPEGLRCTCWHVEDARKRILGMAQP